MKNTINIITLGCSKNVVDSEHIAGQLARGGWSVAFDPEVVKCNVLVINTCGFIGDAKQESIDTILAAAAAKERGEVERIFVIGCLSERYRDELRAELPEVDEFFGARDLSEVIRALNTDYNSLVYNERLTSTPAHYAYLKISEGCDRRCSFCAIPLIRGGHVSVPMEQLTAEAETLAAQGVKELIVIAQDTTFYGVDIYGKRMLAELLRRLCRIDGIEWIRLHYAYPAGFPDDVIEVMRDQPKICEYLDIPLQHIADSQLRSMKRAIDKKGTLELLARLRREIPGIAIRTTLLVGFPGETEADFEELKQFVRDVRFERLGVFAYSEEEGTYAAEELADDVPEEVKERRAEEIMAIQAQISEENNLSKTGRELDVIIDSSDGQFYYGRSRWDSPEVDQEIILSSDRQLRPGDFCRVRVTKADVYDLYAETF